VKKLLLLCSTAACCMPATAYAQSTGSVDFEKPAIVVTGTRAKQVGGVQTPETAKAKVVLTQEFIARQNPGQTILDTINLVPGVSFQNNDAYGSSGGTLTIRGFDASRISLTWDGIQLNDSGNYAIYSNQQFDPELIQQVSVNLGSTDVDSPTASAVGGTVNYLTIVPSKEMGGRMAISLGEYDFRRFFGLFQTGEIGPWGTRAFIAASSAKNENPFNNYGKVNKQQYNARIYQPLGANGDFISIAGHYNQNRNNFFCSLPLRTDLTQSATDPRPRNVGPLSTQRYPRSGDERKYDINYPCRTDTPQPGVADTIAPSTLDEGSCGTEFDRRYNPSNTGNIRGASRFTLADNLILTVDPNYQYVKANGGGTVTGREGFRTINGVQYTGFIGGQYYFGRDLNGDGDILDTCAPAGSSCSSSNLFGVTLLAPSQTHTDRYGLIAGLRWEINPDQMVRVGYTLDDAHHRQTGELGFLKHNGEPEDVFPINDPIQDSNGNNVQKRDRKSLALLNQVSGEYRGEFLDNRLTIDIGVRAPFFVRKLNNYCFTTSASGFVDCFGQDSAFEAAYAAAFPNIQGPQKRKFKYNKLLPNVGAVYNFTPQISAFANYSKNLSVPSTDNLYNSFFFPADTSEAKPKPETTDSFDGGLRYRSGNIQAELSGWYTKFHNRTASAFDAELNQSVFRNLGSVNKWGFDGLVSYKVVRNLTVYAFGSWNQSKIKDNIQTGLLPVGVTCDNVVPGSPAALRSCAFTAGNRESGSPKYMYGLSTNATVGPFDVGFTAKRTGPRFIFDNNQAMFRGDVDLVGVGGPEQIYGKTAPAYWLVNLDARYNLAHLAPDLKDTYFQFNVYNLFDKFYVGGFGGGLSQTINAATGVYGAPPFVQIGAPRTISGTLNIGF
jgi:iron complex outermembrane receptor protein